MDLKDVRNKIDFLDSKILKLLGDRMEFAIMSKKFKDNIEDKGREEELLERIRKNARGVINSEFCSKMYENIITESKKLQKKDYKFICFQGEHGAYSEIAARTWNEKYIPMATKDFADVFEGVQSGSYEYGIVPVENTLGGIIGQVNNLMISSDLKIVGAVELSISHCLAIPPGANHREIKHVYSHPQALSQCRNFLQRNNLEKKSYYDTAGAAKMISYKQLKTSASISSKLAAEMYNLEIIKEDIQDLKTNKTRFLVIAKEENEKVEGNKCSISFTTEHKAGTLFKVLEIFSKENLNLTRIESLPNQPGNYTFFIDFEGSIKDKKVLDSIEKVKEITDDFKFMGCYKEIIA
jgi:prephenate dehydratase/chorismate mutase/prephenate dehydratase